MSDRPISRNAPCPCGSGKKFKQCCISKDFEYEEDEHGTVRRAVPMTEDLESELARHLADLEQQHGRPLEDDDLLFPNSHLEHVEHELSQAMAKSGIDPALIHAMEETGLLVSEANQHVISDEDLARWHAAVEEYREQHEIDDGWEGVEFPVGTIALYGPDDKTTTKIVAGVIAEPGAKPKLNRFVGTNIANDPKIENAITTFFEEHGVQQVSAAEGNIGCPHEEGDDFPEGGDCPFCPFWKGKQGSGAG